MSFNYITASLLNQWLYYLNNEHSELESFLATLNRDKFEMSEAMQAGIDFENKLQADCVAGVISEDEEYQRLLNNCYNGAWQIDVQGEYNGIKIVGKADIIHPNKIIDVKFTNRYTTGKYFNTSQHFIYPYCTGIHDFEYNVWSGGKFYIEPYKYQTGTCEKLIDDFINWLDIAGYKKIWIDKWVK